MNYLICLKKVVFKLYAFRQNKYTFPVRFQLNVLCRVTCRTLGARSLEMRLSKLEGDRLFIPIAALNIHKPYIVANLLYTAGILS